MSVPVMNLNSSPPTWPGEPLLDDAFESLPGFCLGVGDQFLDRLERRRRRHREQQMAARHQRRSAESRARYRRAGASTRCGAHRQRPDRRHAQRVAVGRRFGGEVEADGERAAGPVVDDDLLAESLRRARAAKRRASVSVALPAACGTMSWIGWSGYCACAGAGEGAGEQKTTSKVARRRICAGIPAHRASRLRAST